MNRQEILFIGCIVLLVFAGICLPASAAPTFSNILPTSGTTAGGTSVTITGTGFTGATSVTFGGTAATSFTVVSNTSITATTPAGTAGAASIVITTPGGTATGTYTYTASAPSFTSVSPTSGTTAGGTSVTITGTGFTGATAVTFGTTPATSFTVNSATSITATTPAGTAGAAEHRYYNTRWHRYRDIHVYSFGTVIYQRFTNIRHNSRWHLSDHYRDRLYRCNCRNLRHYTGNFVHG